MCLFYTCSIITRVWVCGYCTSSIIIIRVGGVGVWILYMQHITRVWVCGVRGYVDVIHAAKLIAGLLGENIIFLCSECERCSSMICTVKQLHSNIVGC